ncbi:TonB-dependent receptor plug domain-containing protein [Sulfuritortus calidifontis]|uniref:TonB-dependent receptor plug domain-containing protein n=1 Tax=Sulfuritortus calidifontis TaxID=1914471 RepID=UPI001404558A|nr:TonB-dependent receptor [Sulfuritortus calidifontis]
MPALLAALAWQAGPVAATAAPPDLASFALEDLLNMEVFSASKFQQKASEAPSAVTVITAEEIMAYGHRTLADILKTIRGVYVSYDRNYSYVGVRGFGRPGDYNTRLLLLVDGHRVNDNVYDGGLVGSDFILDVDLIERVEFVPGPGSAIYGNNALFGVINVITKQGRQLDGAEVSAEVASHDTWKTRASYGRRLDNGLEVLLSIGRYDSQGQNLFYPEFGGTAVGLDHDRADNFYGKFSFADFTLSLAHADRKKGVPTASYGQDFNDPRSATIDRQSFLDLQYQQRLTEQLEFTGRAYYGLYHFSGDYPYSGVVNHDRTDGRWWGGELKFVHTAFQNHKLVFGAEYQRDGQRDQANYDLDPYAVYLDDRRRSQRWGLYLQDEYSLSERTLLSAGLRFDRSAEGHESVNPRLGLIHRWDNTTTLKALYGTAFRAPDAYELYYTALGPPDQLANPNLRPEKIKTYELVLEKVIGSDIRLTAATYHYVIDNLIEQVTLPGGDLMFNNIAQAKANGIELEAERRWADGSQLRASYSWQLAEREDGTWLDNSPRHLAKLNWSQPILGNRWRSGLELQYLGSRRTSHPGISAGSSVVTNLTLTSSKLAKGLEVSAGIYNLFDQDCVDPGSDEHSQALLHQDGRTWRLKLGYRF